MAKLVRYVALLRAVNVGRSARIAMSELVEQFDALGLSEIRTYVQSGNVVFTASESADILVGRIEAQLEKRFGAHIAVLLRSSAELQNTVDHSPFLANGRDPASLHIMFLAEVPPADRVLAIDHGESDDGCVLVGDTVYVCCPNGYGRTKLTNAYFEKQLDAVATTRGWKTIGALLELCASADVV